MKGFSKLAKVDDGYSLLFFSEKLGELVRVFSIGGLSGGRGGPAPFIYLTYYFVS